MKHWKQWISFAAVLLFVMTTCFITMSLLQLPLIQAQSEGSSTPVPNDGSSYSLQYHKQLALKSDPKHDPTATVSASKSAISLPVLEIWQLYPILFPYDRQNTR